jgi:hypothetical protein
MDIGFDGCCCDVPLCPCDPMPLLARAAFDIYAPGPGDCNCSVGLFPGGFYEVPAYVTSDWCGWRWGPYQAGRGCPDWPATYVTISARLIPTDADYKLRVEYLQTSSSYLFQAVSLVAFECGFDLDECGTFDVAPAWAEKQSYAVEWQKTIPWCNLLDNPTCHIWIPQP